MNSCNHFINEFRWFMNSLNSFMNLGVPRFKMRVSGTSDVIFMHAQAVWAVISLLQESVTGGLSDFLVLKMTKWTGLCLKWHLETTTICTSQLKQVHVTCWRQVIIIKFLIVLLAWRWAPGPGSAGQSRQCEAKHHTRCASLSGHCQWRYAIYTGVTGNPDPSHYHASDIGAIAIQ